MDYRPLGSTGINVSEIGFGCGNVGGLMIRGEHGEQVQAVARAMELGINYFDTASSYGDGVSETNLGRVLKELAADVYVGTKFRVTTHEPGRIKGNVIASVEESLTRMQREQVDLIQMHNHVTSASGGGSVSPEETLGEVVDALRELRDQGKVRFWGMTAVGETAALRRVIESGTLNTIQSVYNLVNPSAGAVVLPGFDMPDYGNQIERAAANSMGVLVIRVLAAGALSGEPTRHPVAVPTVAPIGSGRDYDQDRSRGEGFRFLVQEGHAGSLVEASLRFALGNPGVSSVLVGYSSLEHLEQSVEYAARGPLPPEATARLPEVWAGFTG
ncbi:MAG: aldo/keto reductase [Dehalococcoidia bacterium]|nr:aldo/keto reductase [Dehalococcoidia bacterium]